MNLFARFMVYLPEFQPPDDMFPQGTKYKTLDAYRVKRSSDFIKNFIKSSGLSMGTSYDASLGSQYKKVYSFVRSVCMVEFALTRREKSLLSEYKNTKLNVDMLVAVSPGVDYGGKTLYEKMSLVFTKAQLMSMYDRKNPNSPLSIKITNLFAMRTAVREKLEALHLECQKFVASWRSTITSVVLEARMVDLTLQQNSDSLEEKCLASIVGLDPAPFRQMPNLITEYKALDTLVKRELDTYRMVIMNSEKM